MIKQTSAQYLGDEGEAIGEVGEYLGEEGDICAGAMEKIRDRVVRHATMNVQVGESVKK